MHFPAAALALLVERFIGFPEKFHRSIGHPVEWIGSFIALLDARFNPPEQPASRQAGIAVLFVLLAVTGGLATIMAIFFRLLPQGWIVEALIATPLLAQKSLGEHVGAVAQGLDSSLAQGSAAVSRIVGRDPEALDRPGVARAALESLAENFSDGVVAPAFWFALLGLPGIVLYKAINTADSMVGHKSPRHLAFGWASARLDDLVNLPCSRLAALILALAALSFGSKGARAAFTTMARDAHLHVSPNAGWPESALAGALGIRLGGPRSYNGELVDLATMGDGRDNLDQTDIRRGLALYGRGLWLLTALWVALAVLS